MPAKQIQNDVNLPKDYIPSEDEQYMNQFQLSFFKRKLIDSRIILQEELENINEQIHSSANVDIDLSDKVSNEIILFSQIKRLDSIQKSINLIDDSLERIVHGKYGFCQKTNQKIGIKRLLANPEAKFCLEVQEVSEQE